MPCREGSDPADFEGGGIDPIDDPTTPDPDISIIDGVPTSNFPGKAQFAVVLSNEHDVNVSVRWDTSNGAAQAGTHYTAATNQTLTIPAGDTEATIEVNLLAAPNVQGNAYFYVTLSNPVNCTISDAQGIVWVPYPRGTNPPPPPPPPPPSDNSFTGFQKPGVVYDQTLGCDYTYACTSSASGGAVSGLIQYNRGQRNGGNVVLDWKKLYRDAGDGGCLSCNHSCPGENWLDPLRHMHTTGIKELNSSRYHKINFSEIQRNNGKPYVISEVKKAVRANGAVYLCSPWYSDLSAGEPGWNKCFSCNGFVVQNPDNNGPFGKNTSPGIGGTFDACDHLKNMSNAVFGHCWIITGWNDNKANGAFEIQHAAGRDWGSDGRGYMPYSYLGISGRWHYYRVVYAGHT